MSESKLMSYITTDFVSKSDMRVGIVPKYSITLL